MYCLPQLEECKYKVIYANLHRTNSDTVIDFFHKPLAPNVSVPAAGAPEHVYHGPVKNMLGSMYV